MQIKYFWRMQTLYVSLLMLVGCSSTNELPDPEKPIEEKFIKAPIGFYGEITNITESPLTRADEAKDWYSFQVYSRPEGSSESYKYYAYGFFDNKENMIINLKDGYEYKFDAQMITEASTKVYKFALFNSGWASVENSFFISSEEHVRYMYEGYLYMSRPNGTYDRPNIDRFFGRTEDYVPTEGKVIQINMKRVSFGAKFVATNFTSGNLEISVEGAPTIFLSSEKGSSIEEIISFNQLDKAYTTGDDYTENIPVNIVWAKSDNVRVPIASESINFKRNKLTTIEFEVKENTVGNSFDINANETMETGNTFNIGGDGTNTEVDPKK